jgi:DNA-binding transcriptional LysR family regulator
MHSLTLIDLAALLTRYHQEHPEVRLVPSPAEGGSAELVRDISEGKLDIAFASPAAPYPRTWRSAPSRRRRCSWPAHPTIVWRVGIA